MKDVRLTVKKRAFPSQGRVRLNIAHLPELGIKEGEHVDLINEISKKTVTATVIADTMVREGQVRVSEEDLKAVGLSDDDEVLVRKTPPFQEKIKKAAADANKSFSKGVDKLDESMKKTAASVKKETKKVSDSVEEVVAKATGKGKKSVKMAKAEEPDLENKYDDPVFDDAGFDDEHH